MSLYRVEIERDPIVVEVDGDSMSQVVNLASLRVQGRVSRVELLTDPNPNEPPPEADVVGGCEGCGRLLLDFEDYATDEDGIVLCGRCMKETANHG